MSGNSDSQRIYIVLDRIEDKQEKNHVELIGRISKLEVMSHGSDDCPGVKRVEASLAGHISNDKSTKQQEYWKNWGKEILKLAAACFAGFAGGKG